MEVNIEWTGRLQTSKYKCQRVVLECTGRYIIRCRKYTVSHRDKTSNAWWRRESIIRLRRKWKRNFVSFSSCYPSNPRKKLANDTKLPLHFLRTLIINSPRCLHGKTKGFLLKQLITANRNCKNLDPYDFGRRQRKCKNAPKHSCSDVICWVTF